jgi:hypothetical protein
MDWLQKNEPPCLNSLLNYKLFIHFLEALFSPSPIKNVASIGIPENGFICFEAANPNFELIRTDCIFYNNPGSKK